MIRYIYTLALVFITFTGFAQNKRANIWYFGRNAGLDFSTKPPAPLTDGKIYTDESAGATICDTSGKLIFYTDGFTVYNSHHRIMMNGLGLNGHTSSTQSAIIVPWPENDSLFYIFTTDAGGGYGGLEWHLVNMKLDSGRGAVISKNNLILSPVCEKISATFHANGQDTWVVVHGFSREYGPYLNDSFYSYLITNEGLHTCPVISRSGAIHGLERSSGGHVDGSDAQGQMKFSKDGTTLLTTVYGQNKIEIFDFNTANGKIEKLIHTLKTGDFPYGVEMHNNYVYVTTILLNNSILTQYDLSLIQDDSINNHIQFLAQSFTSKQLTGLQRGLDSNIYLGVINDTYASAILEPDSLGSNSKVTPSYISLNGKRSMYGFPNYISNYFNTQEPPFYYSLSSDSINIYTQMNSPKWLIYKDGVLTDSSTLKNPSFKTSDNSHYIVKLITASNDTFERKAYTKPALVSTHNLIVCDKDSFLLIANKDYHCVYWQDTLYTSDLWIYKNGVYKVNGLDGNNSYSADSIKVIFLKTPQLNLGKDTAFCGNDIYTLKGDSGYKYLWNTGDTSISIDVTQAGVYFLTEKNGICETTDTIKLDILPIPHPTISKLGGILNVNPAYTNYQWYKNLQPINGAKASQYIAQANGNYYVVVIDSNGCEGSSDTAGLNYGIEEVTQSKPLVFPNPANEKVYIECNYFVSWQLFDITGNLIDKGNIKTLEIRNHSSGIYLLKITSEINSYTYKLIKQ